MCRKNKKDLLHEAPSTLDWVCQSFADLGQAKLLRAPCVCGWCSVDGRQAAAHEGWDPQEIPLMHKKKDAVT